MYASLKPSKVPSSSKGAIRSTMQRFQPDPSSNVVAGLDNIYSKAEFGGAFECVDNVPEFGGVDRATLRSKEYVDRLDGDVCVLV